MILRSVLVRALEWRGRWFSDPVDRLQYLRRNAGARVETPKRRKRILKPMPALAITVGLVMGSAGGDFTAERHVTAASSPVGARAHGVQEGERRAPEVMAIPSLTDRASPIWLVKKT